ncbi:hypothetical protein CANCADRAFT_28468 [Tortispora caseinolytica NRRL Y-17796]|uniref:Ketoreductase domain-containing protein n=1 Tax=Tortispora caseinolytica NRRL Y-17796 TaxID=767744 RepID=A0A1E4TC01_9ASCO|nr:hypothetical protein CANCADRAFT_28468 [Tortispora caseinolytica NRRL Y-17796]
MSLTGKIALITGGSRGIGYSIARLFAENGGKCIIVSRNLDSVQKAARSLPFPERKHLGVSHNVSQPWTDDPFEPIDIVVNAAGIPQNSLLMRLKTEEIDALIDTNLKGSILTTKKFVPSLLKTKGCIVHVSSVLGSIGSPGSSVYAASKVGIEGFSRSLAAELGPKGVRSNVIVPGLVETDMTKTIAPKILEQMKTKIPLARLGTPEEIAHTALFLATNNYINGASIRVDGGMSTSL